MRVNRRYINSTNGTSSDKEAPDRHNYIPSISGILSNTDVYRHMTETFFIPDLTWSAVPHRVKVKEINSKVDQVNAH